jgi:hypothetical protein
MTLSPSCKVFKIASIEASPEAKANPCLPFSIQAIDFSRAKRVGFPLLESSKPLLFSSVF